MNLLKSKVAIHGSKTLEAAKYKTSLSLELVLRRNNNDKVFYHLLPMEGGSTSPPLGCGGGPVADWTNMVQVALCQFQA